METPLRNALARFLLPLAAAAALAGCKAAPGAAAGFVDDARMTKPAGLPFQKAWVDPAVDWSRYRKILIAPVDTSHLPRMEWAKAVDKQERLREDAEKLAVYAREIFERTFREDPEGRFEVAEAADGETVVFELALVEILPSKLAINTLCYAPFVGTAVRIFRGLKHRSTVAFEARVKDGATGAVIAQFADREAEKAAVINVKDVTWYGHAESILAEWARQFTRVFNREPGEAVRDSKPFTLKPW
jgi:hypothetical protein